MIIPTALNRFTRGELYFFFWAEFGEDSGGKGVCKIWTFDGGFDNDDDARRLSFCSSLPISFSLSPSNSYSARLFPLTSLLPPWKSITITRSMSHTNYNLQPLGGSVLQSSRLTVSGVIYDQLQSHHLHSRSQLVN